MLVAVWVNEQNRAELAVELKSVHTGPGYECRNRDHAEIPRLWTPHRRRARRALCEPLSVRYRTGLCTPETEIEKSPAETGARNPPRKSRNARNCRPETGSPQPNPRECRRFSPTGKYPPGDRTAWLMTQSAANPSRAEIPGRGRAASIDWSFYARPNQLLPARVP
jgi:hypothetical protein